MKTLICRTILVLLAVTVQINFGHSQEINRFVGEWEVWIPGAINYTSRDAAVYQVYTPGAPMNRLVIKTNGKYIWGDRQGSLKKVDPWYAQPGRDYYRISDKPGNTYDFWYNTETDQLVVLFGEVGGHAATGSRWKGSRPEHDDVSGSDTTQATHPEAEAGPHETAGHVPSATPDQGKSPTANSYVVGEQVEILWSGGWYKGTVLEIDKAKYKVHYTEWGSLYDEWVEAARLRKATTDQSTR